VHLNDDAVVRSESVMKSPGGMSEGSRVDNDPVTSTSSRMHRFDEFSFVIALKIFHFATKFGR
jgi:hypothetical protein